MRMFLIGLLVLVVVIIGGLFFLAQQSASGAAPGLADGRLAPCPSSPNCVSSEAGTDSDHAIDPLPPGAWSKLPETVTAMGATITERSDDYLAAEFRTSVMKFVDDVEFRRTEDAVHVRSASRVGHSDMGANAKRVTALRDALSQ